MRRNARRAAAGIAALALSAACGGNGGSGPRLTQGSADLTVNRQAAADTLQIVDRFFDPGDCAVIEGATQAGARRLLRFDTVIENHGTEPMVIGDPSAPEPPFVPGDFEYSPCHDHFHFTGFAEYALLDSEGDPVALGHKQAFCLLDSVMVVSGSLSEGFDCLFQGISSGWGDVYDRGLDGQWVDITGVPPGSYTLVITVNANGKLDEGLDLRPNQVEIDVTIPP